MSSKDIEALRAFGFGDESVLEAVVVTALAVYRCTLSVALGPEPDFEARSLASSRTDPHRGVVLHRSLPNAHELVHRKGPYVPAPYLSPDMFPLFCHC